MTQTEAKHMLADVATPEDILTSAVPVSLACDSIDQTLIPAIAQDPERIAEIDEALTGLPTRHFLCRADSRELDFLQPGSVHLIVTSPPYWTLKQYRDTEAQLGHIADYDRFLGDLDRVWKHCFEALTPGGRLVCVVGDVCLSRKKNNGRHTVVPLHASIQERCRRIGFDNLAPIIWHKIANATYEVDGAGGFL